MSTATTINSRDLMVRRKQPLAMPTDLMTEATRDISAAMNGLLADVIALHIRTRNVRWHVSGPRFRSHHRMLDEHAEQLFAMTDPLTERIRKVGGISLRSIGPVAPNPRSSVTDAISVNPLDMLAELRQDNIMMTARLRETQNVCYECRDIASASLIKVWINESWTRTWNLFETTHRDTAT